MTTEHYDYFVIGAGSGGVRSARIAGSHGAKVGIAEKSSLGGTCVNIGCVPKKLFSYGADYGTSLKDMKAYGWDVQHAQFNWKTLLENKNNEISRLNGIYESLLNNAGVDLYRGTAKLINEHTIDIDGKTVTADTILIATGGTPRRPNFPGSGHALVSDEIFFIEDFPKSVVVQGGGYIAVEFAHILHGLGAHVTLMYRGDMWLRGFDEELRCFLVEEYKKQGIDVRFNCDIEKIEATDSSVYNVHATNGDHVTCDLILSAIGRTPNVQELNLEGVGIAQENSSKIIVNDDWQTSIPHIYAVGDVSNSWNLTPYAIAEGHILADRLFGKDIQERQINFDLVPTAIFSSPNMGVVGLTEQDALSQNIDVEVYKTSFRPLRHTLTDNEEKTFMKLIVCKDSRKVIGCHMCGEGTSEILQGIAIAMNAGATKEDFDRTIGVHPTSAEELVTLRDAQPPRTHGC